MTAMRTDGRRASGPEHRLPHEGRRVEPTMRASQRAVRGAADVASRPSRQASVERACSRLPPALIPAADGRRRDAEADRHRRRQPCRSCTSTKRPRVERRTVKPQGLRTWSESSVTHPGGAEDGVEPAMTGGSTGRCVSSSSPRRGRSPRRAWPGAAGSPPGVLEVGVDRDDHVTPRLEESGLECRRLPEVSAETDDDDVRRPGGELGEHGHAAVRRAVIDEDHLEGLVARVERA